MASQPANTSISVKYMLRSQRYVLRSTSVKELSQKMMPLVMQVAGQERQVLQTTTGVPIPQTYFGGKDGLPVVRYVRGWKSFEDAVEGISNLEYPVVIGSDKFLEKTAGHVTDDIQQELRDL